MTFALKYSIKSLICLIFKINKISLETQIFSSFAAKKNFSHRVLLLTLIFKIVYSRKFLFFSIFSFANYAILCVFKDFLLQLFSYIYFFLYTILLVSGVLILIEVKSPQKTQNKQKNKTLFLAFKEFVRKAILVTSCSFYRVFFFGGNLVFSICGNNVFFYFCLFFGYTNCEYFSEEKCRGK